MYDPHSEAHEFIGKDRKEALAKAVAFFGVGEEELVVSEVDSTRASGVGTRFVLVAYPRSAGPPSRQAAERGGEPRRGEGRRERGEGRRGGEEMRRGGGRSERGEERRGGRWRGEGEGGRGRGGRHEGEGVREMPERPVREPEDVGPSVGTATTPLTAVGQFVCGVIERMGMGSFSISESGETEGLTAIQIHGGAAARLASGDGRAMDAIQLLANQVSLRTGGDDARRVVLDVEGDADQRATFLARIASRAAQRAKETGRPVALEPMSPRDRRTVHVALREEEGIATMSVGESRYRQVVVVPESAPEYEEAKRYEAESQRESRD